MVERQLAIYVPISAVFPGVEPNIETLRSLLQGISRTDALVWCARLNLAVCDQAKAPIERQKLGVERFLSPEEIRRVCAYAQSEESGGKPILVFSRGQLLELMRLVATYCEDLPGDGETFNDPEVRRKFCQAALICSRILDVAIWGKGPVDNTALALLQGNAPDLARKAAEATSTVDLNICLGRGWALFRDYLPKHYPSFDEEFRSSTGLSIEQYFACLAMVLADSVRPAQEAGFSYSTVLQRNPYNDAFQRYMSLESQTPVDLQARSCVSLPESLASLEEIPPYSRRPLLDRPILRTENGLAVILDPFFFGESAQASPLFHVRRPKKAKDQKPFEAFGHAFEDYINGILGRMFPTSPILAKRLLVGKEEIGLPLDACINDIGNLVLIETKSVWMTEEIMLTDSSEEYKAFLRSKYVEPKGVGQLTRAISVLSDSGQSGVHGKYKDASVVYPVMIVRDQFIAAPYFGRFMQSEFQACLNPDEILPSRRMKKGRLIVAPLTVIGVDILEGLESSVRHQGFIDILDSYTRECSDGAISLGNFIACSPKYEQYFNPRLSVAAKVLEAFKATAREVFPEADLSQL